MSAKARDLGFIKVDSQDIIDWTSVTHSVAGQETQAGNPVPAKAISYIGCPNKPDDFPVRGLTLLQIGRVTELKRREEGKVDSFPTFEQGLLPCYISYKGGQLNERESDQANTFLSHLVVDCCFLPEAESVTYLFTANAGLYYSH